MVGITGPSCQCYEPPMLNVWRTLCTTPRKRIKQPNEWFFSHSCCPFRSIFSRHTQAYSSHSCLVYFFFFLYIYRLFLSFFLLHFDINFLGDFFLSFFFFHFHFRRANIFIAVSALPFNSVCPYRSQWYIYI